MAAEDFDQELMDRLKEQQYREFLKVPELRSILTVFDFRGGLNTVAAPGMLVNDQTVSYNSPDMLLGVLRQVLTVLPELCSRLDETLHEKEAKITEASKTLLQKYKELEIVELQLKEVDDRLRAAGDSSVSEN